MAAPISLDDDAHAVPLAAPLLGLPCFLLLALVRLGIDAALRQPLNRTSTITQRGERMVIGAGVAGLHVARSRDVRPRPAVDSCVGRYVADAEFTGQLPVRQAVRPPCP